MFEHPVYKGDYIAQANSELLWLKDALEKEIQSKFENPLYKSEQKLIYTQWPRFTFLNFQSYIDDKLSSYNPNVYLKKINKLYLLANECVEKYCQMENINRLKLESNFHDFESIFAVNREWPKAAYFHEIRFCLQFLKHHKEIRTIFDQNENGIPGITGLDYSVSYQNDKESIIEILDDLLIGVDEFNIDLLVQNILFVKHSLQEPNKSPTIIFNCSQNKIIKKIRIIREKLNLGPSSRDQLADLFSKIPQGYNNGELVFFNRDTIYTQC
jgi:hypothetical protein